MDKLESLTKEMASMKVSTEARPSHVQKVFLQGNARSSSSKKSRIELSHLQHTAENSTSTAAPMDSEPEIYHGAVDEDRNPRTTLPPRSSAPSPKPRQGETSRSTGKPRPPHRQEQGDLFPHFPPTSREEEADMISCMTAAEQEHVDMTFLNRLQVRYVS